MDKKEKKSAIVSCYFKQNYGSMLQAYATQKALDKLGYKNETINISGFEHEIKKDKLFYFIKASLTSDILSSKIGMAKNVIIKKTIKNQYTELSKIRSEKFDSFCKINFRLSERYKSKKELGIECENKYSNILVGSDQLWLPANIAADYYTLNFAPHCINTIAYATSFGQASLPEDLARKAALFLKRIRHISVREEAGQKIVKELTGRNVPIVCDPTILFTGNEWNEIQKKEPIINEKYILCYFLGTTRKHREFAERLRTETGYKIVALVHLDEFIKSDDEYADITPYNIDPADFLNLIKNAEFICTDSFHCTVFSILYMKNFFTFYRYTKKTVQSTNNRIDSLFKISGIEGRLLEGGEEVKDCLRIETDFYYANRRLEGMRKYSYEYLLESLKDERSTDF